MVRDYVLFFLRIILATIRAKTQLNQEVKINANI